MFPHQAACSSTDQCRQSGCPRLRWRAYYRRWDVRCDPLWLQDRTPIRVLELDSILHRLPHRSR